MPREAGYYARMGLGVYRLLRSPRSADPERAGAIFGNEQHPWHLLSTGRRQG